jgi:hypothetical protein
MQWCKGQLHGLTARRDRVWDSGRRSGPVLAGGWWLVAWSCSSSEECSSKVLPPIAGCGRLGQTFSRGRRPLTRYGLRLLLLANVILEYIRPTISRLPKVSLGFGWHENHPVETELSGSIAPLLHRSVERPIVVQSRPLVELLQVHLHLPLPKQIGKRFYVTATKPDRGMTEKKSVSVRRHAACDECRMRSLFPLAD